MTVPGKEATANHVPAAAVTRRWRALFGFTGRKGSAGGARERVGGAGVCGTRGEKGPGGGPAPPAVKRQGPTLALRRVRPGLSARWADGTPGVAVECVDIRKNTDGEGGLLARD